LALNKFNFPQNAPKWPVDEREDGLLGIGHFSALQDQRNAGNQSQGNSLK
jgi:hypothetical protein